MIALRHASLTIAFLTLALASCSDPVRPDLAIALSVTPATIGLQQGRADSVIVFVESLNGFASTVTLSVEGAPAGVVTGFTSGLTSIPITANTGVNIGLWITVDASAAPGNHTLTVRARSQGVDDQTARVTLTVIHARPTLALALTRSARTIATGQRVDLAATIRGGGTLPGRA